jgi:hypothetical protein
MADPLPASAPQSSGPIPATQGAIHLTLAVIARNEQAVLARCLESVRGVADEIVVADTGSTDQTRALAEAAGARVLDFPWCDDFSAARNATLQAARGRWILVLDADETLEPEAREALRTLVSQPAPPRCAYRLINCSTQDQGRTGVLGKIVRLFPNHPEVRYAWPIHEQVEESLLKAGFPILDSTLRILHTGYSDKATNQRKQQRNLRILNALLARSASLPPMLHFLRGGALLDTGATQEALEAYGRCESSQPAGSELWKAARVRQATCLLELQRPEEVLALLPQEPPLQWHPELLLHAGTAALQTQQTAQGLAWLQTVLSASNSASIPAYDPVRVRAQAVASIAAFLQPHDPRQAVLLLRLASVSVQSGELIPAAILQQIRWPGGIASPAP